MMPESNEPFGRRRWDPLVDIEQPLTLKNPMPPADGEPDEPDRPSPTPTATSA